MIIDYIEFIISIADQESIAIIYTLSKLFIADSIYDSRYTSLATERVYILYEIFDLYLYNRRYIFFIRISRT